MVQGLAGPGWQFGEGLAGLTQAPRQTPGRHRVALTRQGHHAIGRHVYVANVGVILCLEVLDTLGGEEPGLLATTARHNLDWFSIKHSVGSVLEGFSNKSENS